MAEARDQQHHGVPGLRVGVVREVQQGRECLGHGPPRGGAFGGAPGAVRDGGDQPEQLPPVAGPVEGQPGEAGDGGGRGVVDAALVAQRGEQLVRRLLAYGRVLGRHRAQQSGDVVGGPVRVRELPPVDLHAPTMARTSDNAAVRRRAQGAPTVR
ncbi:hypothetical protein [Streptomyces puniciscabiei]|uniref:hypothetical protein n=1 Tax=Streptomyces puniciscabiei TaxID=164348 RepID=UPI0037BC48AA